MSIVDGKGLVTWEGGLFEPGSDLLRRVQWAFGQIRDAGGHIALNEAGRPYGVPSDRFARSSSQTESGISTVWFQWGRYLRGETPSAADPSGGVLASQHTQGIAIDCNAPTVFDMTLRARFFAVVGMAQTISSESWHWAIVRPSSVDVSSYGNATEIKSGSPEEDDDMTAYLITSGAGQSLWLDGLSISLDEAQRDAIKGAKTLEVAADTHNRIIAASNGALTRSAIPAIVQVEGSGQWLLGGGRYFPAESATVQRFLEAGAALLTISQAQHADWVQQLGK